MGKRVGLIVAHDTHCGGTTGLLPPHGLTTDDGNVIKPNTFQEWTWERFNEAAFRADVLTQDCDERHLILNGDLVDGWHHGTWQVLSANPTIQRRVALEALSPLISLKPTKTYVVRGTPAHVGEQGHVEEDIAEALDCPQDEETGNYSRYRLEAQVLHKKILVFHHGKSGSYTWTRSAGVQRLAWQIRTSYDHNGRVPPDLVFVGHKHHWDDSGMFSCPTRVLMGPGWQGPTQYVHKNIVWDGSTEVGMWVAIIEEGVPDVLLHPIRFKPKNPKTEVIA